MNKLKNNKNYIMRKMFDYILEKKLVDTFDLNKIKSEANDFYNKFYASKSKETKKELILEIEKFSIYDTSNYEGFDSKTISGLIIVLSIFKPEFVRKLALNTNNKRYMDFGELKRKVSPPIEAYEYVGNNKLDITPTHRSYGLLFE